MRSIRLKIMLIGAISSILMMILGLSISYAMYYNGTKNVLLNKIDDIIDEIDFQIVNENYEDEFVDVFTYVVENATEDTPTFENEEQKREYYRNTFAQLYPPKPGSMGLSMLMGKYSMILSFLKSKAIAADSIVYFSMINWKTNEMIYIADSRDDTNNEYYYAGSKYKFTDADMSSYDKQYDGQGHHDMILINGKTTKIYDIKFISENTNNDMADYNDYSLTCLIEYNLAKVTNVANEFLRTGLIFFSIGFVVLLALYFIITHLLIVNNVIKLKKATKEFSEGLNTNNVKIIDPNVKARDEIGELSKSFINLEEEIISYAKKVEEDAKEKEKINAELQVATNIQLESLPEQSLNDSNVLIEASIKSAKEVGGDFYDYFYIDDKHLAIIISDVSGKGIPAALFMMKSKELIKSKLISKKSIEEVCFEVNNELLENNEAGLFITAFIGVLNLNNNKLEFVNAGHEKPYILSKGTVKQLKINSNFILGGIKDFKYQHDVIELKENDRIFLHTDGLNESINENEKEFGYERILNSLNNNYNNKLSDILTNMDNELNSFTNNKEQFDDITMLILEIKSLKLEFNFNNPGVEIIDEVTNKFSDYYSYLDTRTISCASIIIDELLNNYISYEKKDNLIIKISFGYNDNKLIIKFENNGEYFDPLKVKEKYIENDENLVPGGLGLTMIKKLSSSVSYERINDINQLIICIDSNDKKQSNE